MYKKILGAVAAVVLLVVVVVCGIAASKPDTFRYERTTEIQAPPEPIFALINDFHRWNEWSPYEKLDPAMKRSITGASQGVGAVYSWESEGDAGVGRMEITESSSPSQITIKLDFAKPFSAHNQVVFTLAPQGGRTKVSWAMHGPSPFISKVMSTFLDLDKLVGENLETGLANLKAIAEKPAADALPAPAAAQ